VPGVGGSHVAPASRRLSGGRPALRRARSRDQASKGGC